MNGIMQSALAQLGGNAGGETQNYLYAYVANFTNVAFGATSSQQIRINSGQDFLCLAWPFSAVFNSTTTPTGFPGEALLMRELTAPVVTATPVQYAHLSNVQLGFQTVNRQYNSAPVNADLVTSTGGKLQLLPAAIFIQANDTVNLSVTNGLVAMTGAATPAIDCQWVLWGLACQRKNIQNQ